MAVFGLYVVDVCSVPLIVPCLHSPKMVDVSHVGCEKENVKKTAKRFKNIAAPFYILFRTLQFSFFSFSSFFVFILLFTYVIQLSY